MKKRFGKAPGDRMIPYQFAVPEKVHKRVTKKFKESGIKLAPFMRMYFTKLGQIELERLLVSLQKFNKRQRRGRKQRNEDNE